MTSLDSRNGLEPGARRYGNDFLAAQYTARLAVYLNPVGVGVPRTLEGSFSVVSKPIQISVLSNIELPLDSYFFKQTAER